jgi:hypothetical protein
LVGTIWACSTEGDPHTISFAGDGTANITGYGDYNKVQWRQNGTSVTITLEWSLNYDRMLGTIESGGSMRGWLTPRDPNALRNISFACKLASAAN